MEKDKILKADYLDIVYEGRNKKYGGYELRKNYNKRARNAAIVGVLTIGFLLTLPKLLDAMSNNEKKEVVANLNEVKLADPPPVDPNEPPPPPPPPEPPPPMKPTVAFTPPVIEKDDKVREDEKPPDQTKLKEEVAISTKTQEGDINGIDPGLSGEGTKLTDEPAKPQIYTFVEQMPSYPGGESALRKFLSDNLEYPEQAKSMGQSGTVRVSFVVDENGDISDAYIKKGVSKALDDEALRVVKKMKKWVPGKNNGVPVKVWFTLPIKFTLE